MSGNEWWLVAIVAMLLDVLVVWRVKPRPPGVLSMILFLCRKVRGGCVNTPTR